MSENHSLPFDLNDESLAEWLESISKRPPVNAGSQLNQAINQLRKTDRENNLIFPLLMKLTPVTLHSANALATLLRPGAQKNKTAKIARLCLQLPRNLALAFHGLLETDHLSIPQKLQACYFSLQLIGQYLRLSSLFHELPSETLWKKSGEIYTFAHKHHGLEENVTSKIPEFRYQSSLEQAIKRNLLFTITAFRQQSSADNQALFTFANQHSAKLEFIHAQSNSCFFIWNVRQGIPYPIPPFNRPLQKTEIALNTTKLLSDLQSDCFIGPISEQERERVQHCLAGYEQLVDDTVPSAPIALTMISGFRQIHDFLVFQEKLERIQKLSAQIPERKQQADFALEPLEHEKSFLSGGYSQPPQENLMRPGITEAGNSVKLLQGKSKNYLHIESKRSDWQIGELVLLVNKKNAFMIGKILQSNRIDNIQSTMLLIERIFGSFSAQTMQSDHYKNTMAIVINPQSEHPEALLKYEKYRNGIKINLGRKSARLDSLLDYTPFFTRYRISL